MINGQSWEAQDIKFDQISNSKFSSNNLSQNSVFTILQDPNGFMWFGSQTGLDRYDGISFTRYQNKSPKKNHQISKGFVKSIIQIKDTLWVGTVSGLNKIFFDSDIKDYVSIIEQAFDSIKLLGLSRNRNDDLIYYSTNKVFTRKLGEIYKFEGDIRINNVIPSYESNKLLVGTSKGLFSINDNSNNESKHHVNIEGINIGSEEITALYSPKNNNNYVYLGVGKRVYRCIFENNKLKFINEISLEEEYYNVKVNGFLLDSSLNLWISTENTGLYFLKKNAQTASILFRNPEDQFSLSSNLILSLHQSLDGVIWVGTNGGGINKWASNKQRFYKSFQKFTPSKRKAFNNDIWSILEVEDKIILGTDGHGIAVFDRKELLFIKKDTVNFWMTHKQENNFEKNSILALGKNENDILVGTNAGLYKIPSVKSKYKFTDSLNLIHNLKRISSIYVSDNNEYIVIGSRDHKLLILDIDYNVIELYDSPDLGEIYSIEAGKISNSIFVGSDKGLFLFDLNNVEDLDISQNKINLTGDFSIRSILNQTESNSIWLGTFGDGLLYFDLSLDSILQIYDQENGINNNIVYGILKDKMGSIWISTNDGIAEINRNKNLINNYIVDDGLQSVEFNSGAYYSTPDSNHFFFGGVSGLNWFEPIGLNSSRHNETNSNFAFHYKSNIDWNKGSEIKTSINNNNINLGTIPFEGRAMDITFCVLDYHNPRNNMVEAKLNNKVRRPNNQNHFALTGNKLPDSKPLEEGDYQMELIHRCSYDAWNQHAKTQIIFDVGKPEHKFYLNSLLVALLCSIVALFLSLWFWRSNKNSKIEVESYAQNLKEKNKEIEIVSDDLIFQNQKLQKLHVILNEITRKNFTKDIFNLAVNHLINHEYFPFDYAYIYIIDKHKRVITKHYCNAKDELFSLSPAEWIKAERELDSTTLLENDILNFVLSNPKTILKVKAKDINEITDDLNLKKIDKDKIVLDEKVYKSCFHNELERFFLPIVFRSEVAQEDLENSNFIPSDFTFGVLEVGFPIKFEKKLDKGSLNRLKIYVDNISQTYHKAYLAENTIANKNIPLDNYSEKNPNKYLEKILKSICSKYECDKGHIGLITFDENEENWLPQNDECICYGLSPYDLKKIITRNKKKNKQIYQGIFRHSLATKKYYYTGDVNRDDYYIRGLDGINSQLSVPLRSLDEKYFGVINLYSYKKNFFDEFKALNIQFLADTFSDIFLKKKANFLLNKMVAPLNILLDSLQIYSKIVKFANEYFLTEYTSIWEFQNDSNILLEAYPWNIIEKRIENHFNIEREIKIFQIEDLSDASLKIILPESITMLSCLIAPLYKNKKRIGIIFIPSNRRLLRLFPEDEIFLSQIASKCGLSIYSAELFNSFNKMYDPLYEDNPKAIYQKITEIAKNIFHADVVLLFKNIPGKHINLYDVVSNGNLINKINKQDAKEEPENSSAIDIVIEHGSIFIRNNDEYLKSPLNIEKRDWSSNIWDSDFWEREKIKSLAAFRLGKVENPNGVLFLNYRLIHQDFDDEFKSLLATYIKLAYHAISNALRLEENIKFQESNIKLSKPFIESTIISGIAHDSQNYINSARRRVTYLEEKLSERKKKKIEEIEIDIVSENLKMLSENLKDLDKGFRKVSEFRKIKEEIYLEPISIGNFVRESVQLVIRKAEDKNIICKIIIDANPPIICDKSYLQHAILNLLINAIDEMKRNDKLTVKTEYIDNNNSVKISIRDTGNGIPDELKSKIFEPYFSTKNHGTGIGLPTTKYIVDEVLNGRLEFSTVPRKGSVFSIILPIQN